MSKKEYLAYEGPRFSIEWYFDSNGNSPALDYYTELDASQKRKLLILFKRIGDHGKISDKTKFNNEGEKIYAFKPKPERFLCFFMKGKKIVVTNAFTKKQQKLPEEQKKRALQYKRDYEKRLKEEKYYD